MLYCLDFLEERSTVLNKISEINSNNFALVENILFGDTYLTQSDNSRALNAAIACIFTSKRYNNPNFEFDRSVKKHATRS